MKAVHITGILFGFIAFTLVLFPFLSMAQDTSQDGYICGEGQAVSITSNGLECVCIFGGGVDACNTVESLTQTTSITCDVSANEYLHGIKDGEPVCKVFNLQALGMVPRPPVCVGNNALQWSGTAWSCRAVATASPSPTPPTPPTPTPSAPTNQVITYRGKIEHGTNGLTLRDYDYFGQSVAVSGNTLYVGAYVDDTGGTNRGAVYTFQKDTDGVWQRQHKIAHGTNGLTLRNQDLFGKSIAVSGNTLSVGAPRDDIGGDDDIGAHRDDDRGAVYTFQKDTDGVWQRQHKITHDIIGDLFGQSVALHGNTLYVGAVGDDTDDDIGGDDRGAVYTFQKDDNGVWQRQHKIAHGTNGLTLRDYDYFGKSIAVSGNTLYVGAYLDDTGGNRRGAVYTFQKDDNGVWQRQHKIAHGTNGLTLRDDDYFGQSVAVSGNTLYVGAYGDDTGGGSRGAVYTFQKDDNGVWQRQHKIAHGTNGLTLRRKDRFGRSVALHGNTLYVGAIGDDTGDDTGGTGRGAVYYFDITGQ